jgi:hypothetical protein
MYWGRERSGGHMHGSAQPITSTCEQTDTKADALASEIHDDPHLRSARSLAGYQVDATDGEIGHIEDYMANDQSWLLHFMIVDTRNCLPGRRVLISPQWIERVEWGASKVLVGLSREASLAAPSLIPSSRLASTMEARCTTTTV